MNKFKKTIFRGGLCLTILFASACNSASVKGENGKSAYEIYCQYHPEYTKSEEEWINEFCLSKIKEEDEVNYSICNNFSFYETVIDGTRGYMVKRFFGYDEGDEIDIVIPSHYNNLPVIGVFPEEEDAVERWCPNKIVKSVRFPNTIKLVSFEMLNEVTNDNILPDLYFEGDIKYVVDLIHRNYEISHLGKVCFDGIVDEFLKTNLYKCFCNADIYFKKSNEYVCELPQKRIFEEKSNLLKEEWNNLNLEGGIILSLKENRKFSLPKNLSVQYNGENSKHFIEYTVRISYNKIPYSSNSEAIIYDLSSSEYDSLFDGTSGYTIYIYADIYYNEKVSIHSYIEIQSNKFVSYDE